MKALLLSDIHSSYRVLSSVYENFKDDKELNSIIFTGDVVDMGEPVSFVDEFLWTVKQLEHTLIWVPGNNDFGRAYHRLNARIKSVEGRILNFSGHNFTGVGGSPASWSGQYQGEKAVDKTAIADTIFLSHVPPPGIGSYAKVDNESAYTGKKNLALSDAPLVHICGHIHHTWGVGYLGPTKVVKLAAAYLGYIAVLDLETLQVTFENIFR